MSNIRTAVTSDADAVTRLFCDVFRNGSSADGDQLRAYLERLYLHPENNGGVGSLVHETTSGDISGFLGGYAAPMIYENNPLLAAICGSFMVKDPKAEPLTAPRLMKAFLNGPQDLSLSETASEVSHTMWTKLGGITLPDYSWTWHRSLRPADFLLTTLAARSPMLRHAQSIFKPITRLVDRSVLKRKKDDGKSWLAFGKGENRSFTSVESISQEEFVELFEKCTHVFSPRPAFEKSQLLDILEDAGQKAELGPMTLGKVCGKGDRSLGAIVCHSGQDGILRILQMLAIPKAEAQVLDAVLTYANELGAVSVSGRVQPNFLPEMLGRRIFLSNHNATVVHSRNSDIVNAFKQGNGFANGLVGEYWNRLNGDI
ncbi:hypothetical protein [Roseibium sp.]|uniref:hypothetical protein n=1 Tax=Roseibium sp. TaxID=1936156 RepID=UPI003B52CE9E